MKKLLNFWSILMVFGCNFQDLSERKKRHLPPYSNLHLQSAIKSLESLQTKKGIYRGWGNWTVGPTFFYSLVQYNLANKESSFNAKAVGAGPSFRFYSGGD